MLVLEVKRTKRRADYQLSEGQDLFIDIALQMTFAKCDSTNGAGAPAYIDTPEGSLDLAYEAQARQMIARFANDGHRILMTANINTSELLRSILAIQNSGSQFKGCIAGRSCQPCKRNKKESSIKH